MIRILAERRDPSEARELAATNVGEEPPLRDDDVGIPIRTVKDVPDRLVSGPESAERFEIRARVEAPRKPRVIELVSERLIVEAWPLKVSQRTPQSDSPHLVGLTAAAAPIETRYVNTRISLRSDHVLMRDEALVELRREHVVGKHPFVRHVPVRFRFGVRNVSVLPVVRAAVLLLEIESVHAAIGSAQFARPVTGGKH